MQTIARRKTDMNMGHVYADIELINSVDLTLSKRHIIGEDEVKRMNLRLLVDTGAFMLTINESIQEVLQLPFIENRRAQLADGSFVECAVVGPVEIHFKNRIATGSAMVLEGYAEPLLGVLPLEEMDVLIHPAREELIVNPEHPDFAVLKLK
jgi:clan AA aspartic protease